MIEEVPNTAEQPKNKGKRNEHLKPWMFQPGQSGNPSGRPKGAISLKEFAKKYLQEMPEEEKLEFMKGINKDKVWEMAEGKAKQDLEHTGTVTISHVLDSLENDGRQEIVGQGVENEPSVQNQEQGAEANPVQAEQSPDALQPEQVVTQPDPEIPPTGIHNG